ncbi:hypothetical protein ACFQ1M_00265 [Sungkyunkwania multivorans]|uniref:Uncharacterized protein n=1 Tax=Sungkyunkwania multivorans TaxID=1173618 RepID=A0ABW3CS88_9FLAO
MKTQITSFLFFLTLAFTVNAQDPYLQKDMEYLEPVVDSIAQLYNPRLVMSAEQYVLFKKKLMEFEIRRENVRKMDAPIKKKLSMLKALSKIETREMDDILTRFQHKAYKRVKKEIQPVAIVVGNTNE